ncbi:MAG: hypothetical protein MHM6MM_007778 [Cercozoa sp. M6MM]
MARAYYQRCARWLKAAPSMAIVVLVPESEWANCRLPLQKAIVADRSSELQHDIVEFFDNAHNANVISESSTEHGDSEDSRKLREMMRSVHAVWQQCEATADQYVLFAVWALLSQLCSACHCDTSTEWLQSLPALPDTEDPLVCECWLLECWDAATRLQRRGTVVRFLARTGGCPVAAWESQCVARLKQLRKKLL